LLRQAHWHRSPWRWPPSRTEDRLERIGRGGAGRDTIALKTGAWWGVTGSVSLLSDAMESLVNLAGAMFALAMVTVAARRPTTTTPTATTRPSTSPAASRAC
jgi:hypothetical protein